MEYQTFLKKTKVISFLQEKGGAGKTTLAINVARGLILMKYKVLLVDSDPQGTARDWNEENEGSLIPIIGLDRESLATDIKAVSDGFDFIVIDGAPGLSKLSVAAIKASDLILIPVQPSPYDIWASENLVRLIKERQQITDGKPDAAFIISRVIKNSILSKDILPILKEYEIPVLDFFNTQLVIYPSRASEGKTVHEAPTINQAKIEIDMITHELLERLKNGIKT